jgi:hypothetical protein
MNMPGMGSGAPIPTWIGVLGAIAFAAIAVSHLRHMLRTGGQRSPWHACHVLMALGMLYMYLSAPLASLSVPGGLWRSVFAGAGLITAAWALLGAERVALLLWLLTAVALWSMFYMLSPAPLTPAVTWSLVLWLGADATLWSLDAYRKLEGRLPLLRLSALASGSGPTVPTPGLTVPTSRTARLIGELDISVSMVAMSLGMVYMLATMQLAG